MTPLRQHMIAALHLSGTSARTQDASVREVRLLAQGSHTSPDRLAAQERQRSCLHRKHVDGVAPASMRRCDRGLRFFAHHVLTRAWHTLTRMRPQSTHRLPAVRRVEEVTRLLASAPPVHHHVSFTTVSRLGLRLHDALFLPVADSDGPRLQIPGHRGQGATDRSVPLPEQTLALLRTAWTTPRHPAWRCPATGRDHTHRPTAASPMRRSRVQGAFRTATPRAGITTRGVAIPPLRQASAPPLLDAGVNPRRIQRSLGHTQLATTMRSLHLTHPGQDEASERLNARRHGLLPGPPCVLSARPVPRSPWSAPPSGPSPTARASALSTTVTAATPASAALRAHPVGDTTVSSMPAATGTAPSVSSRQPRSGFSTTWTHNSQGRTS